MLNRLRAILTSFGARADGGRRFEADDTRLAAAALLVHCMSVDGAISAEENRKLRDILARSFRLSGDDLQLLIDEAVTAEAEAVDLYRFTSVLKRQMSEDERVRLVEQLWEIVYADGTSSEFEENLLWRVAELLAVSRQSRLASKLAVAQTAKAAGGPAT